jgi:lysophospholipase L1-like esterase
MKFLLQVIVVFLAILLPLEAAPLTGNTITADGTYTVTTYPGKKYTFAAGGTFGGGSLALNWHDQTDNTGAIAGSPSTAAETYTFTAPTNQVDLVLTGSTSASISISLTLAGNTTDDIEDISGLQTALDAKSNNSSTYGATRVAVYGDSISNFSFIAGTGATGQALTYMTGPALWAQIYSEGRFELLPRTGTYPALQDFGFSGMRVYDLKRGSRLATLLDRNPKMVIELSGTNDVGQYPQTQKTAAFISATRVDLWKSLLANGVERIFALAIPPYEGGIYTTEQTTRADDTNALLVTAAAAIPQVTWIPYPSVFKSSGRPVVSYFRDKIHPNHLGAQTWGAAIWTAMAPYITSTAYDVPVDGADSWITGNPYFTGGTTLATGWEWWFGQPSGVTNSKVTEGSRVWQKFVITGQTENSSGATGAVGTFHRIAASSALAVESSVRLIVRVRTTGLKGLAIKFVPNENNTPSGLEVGTGFSTTGSYPVQLGNAEFLYISPPQTFPAGTTFNVWIQPWGNGTLELAECGVVYQ